MDEDKLVFKSRQFGGAVYRNWFMTRNMLMKLSISISLWYFLN